MTARRQFKIVSLKVVLTDFPSPWLQVELSTPGPSPNPFFVSKPSVGASLALVTFADPGPNQFDYTVQYLWNNLRATIEVA